MSDFPINERLIVLVLVGFAIFALLMPNFFIGIITSPFKHDMKVNADIETVNGLLRNNSTIASTLLEHPEVLTALAQGNVDALYVYEKIYVTVEPTPDGKKYFANEYQNGTRQLGHPFSWFRSDVNLPNNNLKVSANVYDYRIFPSIHYQDLETTDSVNQGYIEQRPNNPNDEFLIVFVTIYEDEIISSKTPNVWLPTQKSFAISSNNVQYYPIEYPYQINIRELESMGNYNDNSHPQAFGQYVQYVPNNQHTNELYNNGTAYNTNNDEHFAGMTSNKNYLIPKGSSNMEDGYLIFEISKTDDVKNIRVLGQFYTFGNADWLLSNSYDVVDTPTPIQTGGFISVR